MTPRPAAPAGLVDDMFSDYAECCLVDLPSPAQSGDAGAIAPEGKPWTS